MFRFVAAATLKAPLKICVHVCSRLFPSLSCLPAVFSYQIKPKIILKENCNVYNSSEKSFFGTLCMNVDYTYQMLSPY